MELRDYIEKGIGLEGTLTDLATKLGQTREAMTAAKGQRRGLPGYACIKLASIIGEEPLSVIAASELVTEKNPERRAYWLPFVGTRQSKGVKRRAHHVP